MAVLEIDCLDAWRKISDLIDDEVSSDLQQKAFRRGDSGKLQILALLVVRSKYLKTQPTSRNSCPAEAAKSPFDGRKSPFGSFLVSNLT